MRTKYPKKQKEFKVNTWIEADLLIPPVMPEGTEILIHDRFTKKTLYISAAYIRKQLLDAKKQQKKKGWVQSRYFVSYWMLPKSPEHKG